MIKELEKEGFPTAHITNMTPIAKVTGSNRIIPGIAIPNPLSDVTLPIDEQRKQHRNFIERALTAISTDISEPRFF